MMFLSSVFSRKEVCCCLAALFADVFFADETCQRFGERRGASVEPFDRRNGGPEEPSSDGMWGVAGVLLPLCKRKRLI